LDLIFSDHFNRYRPGVFSPLRDTLLTHGNQYMRLVDLRSYLEGDRHLMALRQPGRVGSQSDPERGRLRAFLQRPDGRRICGGHLQRDAVRRGEVVSRQIRTASGVTFTKRRDA
jgi:hypothetical protein